MTVLHDDLAVTVAAALNLRNHRDLIIETTGTADWLYTDTPTGEPADYTLHWTRTVLDETGEISHEPHTIVGVFHDLPTHLARILDQPARTPNSPVTLNVSVWAIRYKRIGA
ncbi:Uncharacterised protein [Mycobacteroides abscessus subsp. abscessus]|nr:Uncharacterised protein [Mycobacteroides abscessus subsp. abscessus]